MPDTKYSQLSDSHKVRVNGQILRALQENQPEGIISTFQSAMNAASNATETIGTSKVRPDEAVDKRTQEFQKTLDGLRNKLAPHAKDLPAMPTDDVQQDLGAQQSALRAIRGAMAVSGSDHSAEQAKAIVKSAVNANDAPVASKAHPAATAVFLDAKGNAPKPQKLSYAEQDGAPQLASVPHNAVGSGERSV